MLVRDKTIMREIFRENTTFPFLPTCEAITQYKTLHTKFVKCHYIQSARSADNMFVSCQWTKAYTFSFP